MLVAVRQSVDASQVLPFDPQYLTVTGAALVIFGAMALVPPATTEWRRRKLVYRAESVDAEVLGVHGVAVEERTLGDRYRPDLLYDYEYGGREFRKGVVFAGGPTYWPDRDAMEQIVDEYAPGDAVRVQVDPENPDRGHLHEGATRVGTVGRIAAASILLGATSILVGIA